MSSCTRHTAGYYGWVQGTIKLISTYMPGMPTKREPFALGNQIGRRRKNPLCLLEKISAESKEWNQDQNVFKIASVQLMLVFGFLAQWSAVSKVLANIPWRRLFQNDIMAGLLRYLVQFFFFWLLFFKCAVWIQSLRVCCLHFPVSVLACMLVSACLCLSMQYVYFWHTF